MSKKAEPKVYTSVGWPVLKGEPIYKWVRIGHERYPLTYEQYSRRQARLAKGVGE